jgi:hypothetical protein
MLYSPFQNTFWGRSRHLQLNNSRCLKTILTYNSLTYIIRIFFRILEQGGVWVLERFYLLFFLSVLKHTV